MQPDAVPLFILVADLRMAVVAFNREFLGHLSFLLLFLFPARLEPLEQGGMCGQRFRAFRNSLGLGQFPQCNFHESSYSSFFKSL